MAAEVRQRINAPLGRVWTVFTNLDRTRNLMSGIERAELLTSGEFGVGSRWSETRFAPHRKATEELTVIECEPLRHYLVRTISDGAVFLARTEFFLCGPDRTEVRMTFDSGQPGLFGRMMDAALGGIATRAMVSAMHRDLDDLARLCEHSAELCHPLS
jgi:uncharacterized membrane protein